MLAFQDVPQAAVLHNRFSLFDGADEDVDVGCVIAGRQQGQAVLGGRFENINGAAIGIGGNEGIGDADRLGEPTAKLFDRGGEIAKAKVTEVVSSGV